MKQITSLKKIFVLAILLSPLVIFAQDIQTKRVKFATGKTSIDLKGTIRGNEVIDFLLNAKASQTLKVSLKTSSTSNYFNLMEPAANYEAFYNSSITGVNTFSGKLNKDGDYRIRVYLTRNAARRGDKTNFTLSISVPK